MGPSCRDPTCNRSSGGVKLTDNTTLTEGRMEICESGYRAGLCYENFTHEAAIVLCRELGLSTNNASGSESGLLPYQCQLMENRFTMCSRVRLSCPDIGNNDGDVRLVGGPNEFEGRVEVYVGGVWARLCRQISSALGILCRQLGHEGGGGATGISSRTLYGVGSSSSPSISFIFCQKTENKITECNHTIDYM